MPRKKSSQDESDRDWDEDSNISYHSTRTRNWIIGLMALIVIIVSSGVAYAAISLSLKQTAPSVVDNGTPLMSGCSPLTPTPASIPPGSSGGELFTCGSNPTILGSLTVNGPVSASFSFSPIPTGYTAIYIVTASTQCSQLTTSTMQIFGIGSTGSISFTNTATTQYDYCATFTNAPSGGFPTWTITWTWTQ